MTEKEKMIAGKPYLASDAELKAERTKLRLTQHQFNNSYAEDESRRTSLLNELIPNHGGNLWIEPPFYCDYGYNILAGKNVYFNYNCVVLDVCPVTIGDDCMFGPSVQIYTALHPMDAQQRATLMEYGKPITIGNDVWVGGNVTILPGVTIGDRCVIGAGSVVTKDVPADSFAAGNPAKIIRKIEEV